MPARRRLWAAIARPAGPSLSWRLQARKPRQQRQGVEYAPRMKEREAQQRDPSPIVHVGVGDERPQELDFR